VVTANEPRGAMFQFTLPLEWDEARPRWRLVLAEEGNPLRGLGAWGDGIAHIRMN
jgi:hypothetical protein